MHLRRITVPKHAQQDFPLEQLMFLLAPLFAVYSIVARIGRVLGIEKDFISEDGGAPPP